MWCEIVLEGRFSSLGNEHCAACFRRAARRRDPGLHVRRTLPCPKLPWRILSTLSRILSTRSRALWVLSGVRSDAESLTRLCVCRSVSALTRRGTSRVTQTSSPARHQKKKAEQGRFKLRYNGNFEKFHKHRKRLTATGEVQITRKHKFLFMISICS